MSKCHFPGQIIKFPGAQEHLAGGEQWVIPTSAITVANAVLQLFWADPTSDYNASCRAEQKRRRNGKNRSRELVRHVFKKPLEPLLSLL